MTFFITQVTGILLLFAAFSAQAFIGVPYVTPTNLTPGAPVFVNVYQSECEGILGVTGYPQQAQVGNTITVLYFGTRGQSGEFCTISAGTGTYPIGAYEAGAYHLIVNLKYFNEVGNFNIDTLGEVVFVVDDTQAPMVAVPTLGSTGLLILISLFGITALYLVRKKSPVATALAALLCPALHIPRMAPRKKRSQVNFL